MRTQTHSGGFTIIEVMLFLAVTAALTVGILVGSGIAIGQQRYRDSVNSFKGLIQEQYGQIANVINSEVKNPVCVQSGEGLNFPEEPEQDRGTSDCLIMGRFIHVEPTKATVYNVIGRPTTDMLGGSDEEVLGNFILSTISPEEHDVAWGATLVEPGTDDGLRAAVLILRSPLSGSVLTYIEGDSMDLDAIISADNDNHRPGAMVNDANMTQKDFCVNSGGLPLGASRLAVRINARAANQSAIEIPLQTEGVCE